MTPDRPTAPGSCGGAEAKKDHNHPRLRLQITIRPVSPYHLTIKANRLLGGGGGQIGFAMCQKAEEVRGLTSGVMDLLTGPHHTSFSEPGSFTIRLSRGERPVLAPEYAVNAPVEVMADPVSYTRASSYRAATEGLPICVAVSALEEGGTWPRCYLQWQHGRSRCEQSHGAPLQSRCARVAP